MTNETAQLIVYLEGRIVQTVSLSATLLTVGRTPDNGVALPHPLVARRHAEIRISESSVLLIDLGSSGGTFVGDERLLANQPRQLGDGATIRIGPFTLMYRAAHAAASVTAEIPSDEPAAVVVPAEVAADQPAPPPARPRERERPPRPLGPYSNYLRDMPVVYHESDFLGRFLLIFESVWEPLEQRQDHIDMFFNPRTCPVEFLPWLAGWLGLRLEADWNEARRRSVLIEAFELYRWRGTRYGLARMLELHTGVVPEISDEPATPFVMRVRLTLPADSPLDRQAVEELIRTHKPAHVGYILELRR